MENAERLDIAIGVVAHTARAEQAHELMETVGAVYMSVDNGSLGYRVNHRKVWHRLTRYNTTWSVVIEDDAQPVQDFPNQLEQALQAAPTPVAGLYLGHPEHWQSHRTLRRDLEAAITQAHHQDACFITTQAVLHGVGIAIHTTLVDDMLTHTQASDRPFDFAIRNWARAKGHTISLCIPSLVDHADGPTLLQHQDSNPRHRRRAWRTGTRNAWTSKAVTL